jgi:adenylosuccinate synthase
MKPSDYKYKGKDHKSLPIRSMAENCSPAEQHRRWVNNMPCRRTEILPQIERWIKHFERAKQDPIHLVELDPEKAEISWWYREFLIEIEQLNKSDKVFV